MLEKEHGDTATVRACYESIIAESADVRDEDWILAMAYLGKLEARAGQTDQGLARLHDAFSAAEESKRSRLARDCALELSKELETAGRFAEALRCHQRFHAWYVQLASESAQIQARAAAVKYDTAQALATADTERQRAERLQVSIEQLAQQAEDLSKAAGEDALTGLPNRRRFDTELHALSDRSDALCRLALFDIDHFKRINDDFSHLMGDAVLRRIGLVLSRSCRPTDTIARYGGEECALIARGVSREVMLRICERLREDIAAEDWSSMQAGLVVTVSIGTVGLDELAPGSPVQELVAIADRRLYMAKHAGRNRVIDAD